MKKPQKSTAFGGLIHVATLPVVAMLASCATTPDPQKNPGSHPTPITRVNQRNWVQVSSHPSVWYPRGVPNDIPTDFQSGEWVYTKDDSDTRFFIPFKGIPSAKRQSLCQEALALRSEKKIGEIENDGKFDVKTAAAVVALTPVIIPVFVTAEVVGIYIPPLRLCNW